jgi:hypothetical protein
LYLIELPLFLIACGGFYSNCPLALAVASNLSFVHAVALACASCAQNTPGMAALSSLDYMDAPRHLALLAGLLGCALLSFSASHIIYIRAIFQEHG